MDWSTVKKKLFRFRYSNHILTDFFIKKNTNRQILPNFVANRIGKMKIAPLPFTPEKQNPKVKIFS